MGPRGVFLRLLRVPLAWKIAGANAFLTLALAAGFYALPAALTAPQNSLALVVGGMLIAVILNVGLISIALRPIHELERAAERLWSGATDVRIKRSVVADRDLRRVAHTVDCLLESLEAERARLKQLTTKLIEARSIERAALARELTESVAQSATALALECAALKSANGNGANRESLGRIGHAASELVDEIRRIVRDMHPRHIDELGLEPALRSLIRAAALGNSYELTLATSGIPATAAALPRAVADTLYDVAREALLNARRYSRAKRVDTSLFVERHLARLTITDDGCGFDQAGIDPNKGLGLKLMRERLSLLGGTLEVLSRPGGGTRIVALVPLAAAGDIKPAEAEPNLQGRQHSW